MRTIFALPKTLPLLLLLALLVGPADARAAGGLAPDDQLFRTIAALDTAVFDAFNRCELEKFGSYFTVDVEFYHDKGGVTQSRQTLVESIKNNICGKVRRELVAGTLEVYPMEGYGAIEMGVHRFYHPGKDDVETPGEAKFMHLWQNKDGVWQVTRVLSYDHHALAK